MIRFTLAPSRTPLIPTGSRMPSWLSTDELARQDVEDLAVGVDRDGPRALEHAVDVGARRPRRPRPPRRRRSCWLRMWLPATPAYTVRISTPAIVWAPSIASAIDAHRPVDVAHDALAQAAARDVAHPEDGDPVGVDLAHHRRDLGRPDVESDDDLGSLHPALHSCTTSCGDEPHAQGGHDAAVEPAAPAKPARRSPAWKRARRRSSHPHHDALGVRVVVEEDHRGVGLALGELVRAPARPARPCPGRAAARGGARWPPCRW